MELFAPRIAFDEDEGGEEDAGRTEFVAAVDRDEEELVVVGDDERGRFAGPREDTGGR